MSDLERYIQRREEKNPNFRVGLEEERRNLRIGLLIKELRLERGMDAGTTRLEKLRPPRVLSPDSRITPRALRLRRWRRLPTHSARWSTSSCHDLRGLVSLAVID